MGESGEAPDGAVIGRARVKPDRLAQVRRMPILSHQTPRPACEHSLRTQGCTSSSKSAIRLSACLDLAISPESMATARPSMWHVPVPPHGIIQGIVRPHWPVLVAEHRGE